MIPAPPELALVVALLLLLFGHKIVPRLGRRLGTAAERLRHVDEDVEDGRQRVDDT